MSDCEQIRFYIQQQFDTDLSPEDERAVATHLDSCIPCSRYRSHIEQVVVFAQDQPLAEEYLPAEYETLVARVAEHLPKPALSGFDIIINFFGKVLGLLPRGTSIMKAPEPAIPFPHPSGVEPTDPIRPAEPVSAVASGKIQQEKIDAPAVEEAARKSEAAPGNEITPPASVLTRLADVLEGAEGRAIEPPAKPLPPVAPAPQVAPPPTPQVRPAPTFTPSPIAPAAPVASPPTPQVRPAPVASPPTPQARPAPVSIPHPAERSQPTVTPPPPASSRATAGEKLLKGVDDTDIDRIFTQTLGVSAEAAGAVVRKPVTPAAAAITPPEEHKQETEIPEVKSQPKSGSLFLLDDDTMDKIFAENLGIETGMRETAAEKIKLEDAINKTPASSAMNLQAESALDAPAQSAIENSPPASSPIETKAPAADTSVPIVPPVEVEGLGRLDKRSEAVETGPSQIGAIGKFLLDKQDIQNLEKLTQSDLIETGLRVLTPDAAQDLQALLGRIRMVKGVVGSVIVGHDGILVSTDLPGGIDADSIAVWSLGIYLNVDSAVKKMGRNSVNKLIAQTTQGHLTIADFGAGILATITNDTKPDTLTGVMRVITELVNSN